MSLRTLALAVCAALSVLSSPSRAQDIAPGSVAELTEADRDIVARTPEIVRRTMTELVGEGFVPDALERRVLAGLSSPNLDRDAQPGSLVLGQRRCTIWWYGTGEEPRRRVSNDRCEVGYAADGMTIIRNLTDEHFNVGIIPSGDGTFAYAGRSFLPGHFERGYDATMPDNLLDPAFGNIAGRAVIDDRNLALVTAMVRGREDGDETFFQVVEIPDR